MPSASDELLKTRQFLKTRLQYDVTNFRGYEKEWQHIRDLLFRTAENGESNSALLLGSRGCGKTTLITSVLSDLLPEECFRKNTLIVYLNGLLHTDDRLALKSATAQMNLENAVDGKVFGSFAENLAFLLECLKAGDRKKSKSVVFLLEEFDLFCSHHNQTLLYNLFDVAQSAQAPICVLGITARLDVVELLEKRVKSRFSHRQIFLLPEDNNFEGRIELFKSLLKLPSEKEVKELIKSNKPLPVEFVQNQEMPLLRRKMNYENWSFSSKWVINWNKHIDSLASNTRVLSVMQNLYDYDIVEGTLKNYLFEVVSLLDPLENPQITVENIQHLGQQFEGDDKVLLVCGLSVLELCLVIAMKHHSEIYDRDPFNFEMILTRYNKFANSSTTMQGIERSVVLKAYEHVKNLELIAPISHATSKVQKEYQLHRLLLTYGQISQAVLKSQNLPTEICQWAQSSLV
ncbi:origin recognition complex subunit 4 [Uranotaenia lowii]|uniref:origin recognition complex subunit 4 n=1 Tax=Uranotaenia lowii TaxID=190385 RepID=UPI00247A0404|nr:origin recognition complex subunit 4 [Uranotaenia lowii]